MNLANDTPIAIPPGQLGVLLEQAARRGAEIAITDMVCYHYKDACKRLGISYKSKGKTTVERDKLYLAGRQLQIIGNKGF